MFAYQTRIHFHEADPAGIAFFANSYVLAHNAFEDFVQHLGFTWKDWFDNESWGVPIRQSSCEHLRPMLVGEAVQIKITLERIGDSSFTLLYVFEIAAMTTCEVRMVHTFMDRKTHSKLSIPTDIRSRLEAYQR